MVREKAIFGQSKVVSMNSQIILLRFPHGMSPPGRLHVVEGVIFRGKLRLVRIVKHASKKGNGGCIINCAN